MLFVIGLILIILSLSRDGQLDLVVLSFGVACLIIDRVMDAVEARK